MRSRLLPRALTRISAKETSISSRTLVSVAVVLLLVAVSACASSASPPSPTSAGTLAQAAVTASPSPLPTVAGTPGRKEDLQEKVTPTTEEEDEGPPLPNPLPTVGPGGNPAFAPVPGADMKKNGAAATIHGSATQGQVVFAQNCQACHNVDGKGGLANPGSDDGTVPPLNPIDPGFKATAKGNPAVFAKEIDLFIQHGSRPSGPHPALSMIPWGDQHKLTQQQIADVEAYVMKLNGMSWPSN